jgi:hypothetical protein
MSPMSHLPASPSTTRSAKNRWRAVAVATAMALVLASCEYVAPPIAAPVAPTAAPAAGVGTTAGVETVVTAPTPTSGCVFGAVTADTTFGALLCHYQGLLFEALGRGMTIGTQITDQVQSAIDSHPVDPLLALNSLQGAVQAVEGQLTEIVIQVVTATVSDVAPTSLNCVITASELLQEATQRLQIGGVPMPDLPSWQATFDAAVVLASTGDLIGATTMACDLVPLMEAVLIQS